MSQLAKLTARVVIKFRPLVSGAGVALALDAVHHLTNVCHRSALKSEILDLDDCFISDIYRDHSGMLHPDFTTAVTATHDRWSPGMFIGNLDELGNCLWPETVLTEWVTTCEHHATLYSISDSRLAI